MWKSMRSPSDTLTTHCSVIVELFCLRLTFLSFSVRLSFFCLWLQICVWCHSCCPLHRFRACGKFSAVLSWGSASGSFSANLAFRFFSRHCVAVDSVPRCSRSAPNLTVSLCVLLLAFPLSSWKDLHSLWYYCRRSYRLVVCKSNSQMVHVCIIDSCDWQQFNCYSVILNRKSEEI